MTSTSTVEASPLRRRMIEDMCVRKFGEKTQHDYIRHVEHRQQQPRLQSAFQAQPQSPKLPPRHRGHPHTLNPPPPNLHSAAPQPAQSPAGSFSGGFRTTAPVRAAAQT
jgi:hypothetical protein